MAIQHADVLVLGGGTMGTAAGWALARRGVHVIVLEQFDHVHTNGSHGGQTRIFRHAYAEGARYVPWTLAADRLWADLQKRSGRKILHRIGCLDISAPGQHRAQEAHQTGLEYSIPTEWLSSEEVNRRWPIFNLPDGWDACFGPRAGFVSIADGLTAMADELRASGGTLLERTPGLAWNASDTGVSVETPDGTYTADSLVIAAGAWSVHILRDLDIPLEVRRKPVLWFEVDAATVHHATPQSMPCFIVEDGVGEFYGVPDPARSAVKIGVHSGGEVVDPNSVRRTVDSHDIQDEVWPFIQRTFRGFTGSTVETSVCMYTMTPDEDFVIDRHPEWNHVAIATGFSGHGFKFAPVIGEYLATLVSDPNAGVRPEFGLSRFAEE